MAKKAVEKIGVIPRSIIRTFDRFRNQLFPETKKLIIQEFRISRAQFLVSVKCLASLIFIPLLVNYLIKTFVLLPITENLWNTRQSEIFLNSYQQDYAFQEFQKFQEKLYFDYLLDDTDVFSETKLKNQIFSSSFNNFLSNYSSENNVQKSNYILDNLDKEWTNTHFTLNNKALADSTNEVKLKNIDANAVKVNGINEVSGNELFSEKKITKTNKLPGYDAPASVNASYLKNTIFKQPVVHIFDNSISLQQNIQQQLQYKIFELAMSYNYQSIVALTNLAGDFITFIVISLLLVYMKPQIIILKSFLTESIYSLNDTKKSFLLILGTDLLVGFHSPKGWEVCFQLILRHFGFPENKDFVFLFVASFPVLLDTIFKYWIFRYLNKISPSTVTTYHSMIE